MSVFMLWFLIRNDFRLRISPSVLTLRRRQISLPNGSLTSVRPRLWLKRGSSMILVCRHRRPAGKSLLAGLRPALGNGPAPHSCHSTLLVSTMGGGGGWDHHTITAVLRHTCGGGGWCRDTPVGAVLSCRGLTEVMVGEPDRCGRRRAHTRTH